MLKYKSYLVALLGVLLLSLSACGTYQEASQKQKLQSKLDFYAKTARLGALENLYGFLSPEESAKATPPDYLDNIKVTDYVVRMPTQISEEGTATQGVEINYLFRDQAVIRTLSDHQVWKYDQTHENWYRANPIPEFK